MKKTIYLSVSAVSSAGSSTLIENEGLNTLLEQGWQINKRINVTPPNSEHCSLFQITLTK